MRLLSRWRIAARLLRLGHGAALLGLLLGGAALGALSVAFLGAGEIYDYTDSVDGVHLPAVDAIVCLAGGRGRIAAAGDVWYRYWEQAQRQQVEPPLLYVSGMGPKSTWATVERQVRRGILGALRPEHVVLETQSSNTEENARFLLDEVRRRSWESVLLMTSSYHMKRAKLIFDGVFVDSGRSLRIETLSVYQEPFEPGEWRRSPHGIEVTLVEYLKWLGYRSVWQP
jgi:uncharacterized SAM-binding protein YcdF (DUF218 family)